MSDTTFPKRDPLYSGEHRGIRWEIYQAPMQCALNGYVRLPDDLETDVDQLDVHGGITYGCGVLRGGWIGFDTAHAGDWWDLDELRERVGVHVGSGGLICHEQAVEMAQRYPILGRDHPWTVGELRAECVRLANQVADLAEECP